MSTQTQTPSTYLPQPATAAADEAVLCSGCRLRFDAMHRRPLVLQCLHSFCEMCIRAFAGPKHDKKVTCNVCRATTKLDRNQTGSILPINYAILEKLSVSSRARPVTVIAKSESPVSHCNGQTGQYTSERVTVIPIHKNEADMDQSQRASTNDGDDHSQPNGTTSINVGQRRLPKDSRVTTTTTMTSLPTSSEAKGSRLSMVVTMASSACGPRELSCAAPQPASVNGSCSSQTMAPCMAPNLAPTVTSLMVKSSASASHPSHATGGTSSEANQPPAPVDLCCQCRIHPATLTVARATQMSSQKLCSSCYALIQQHKLDDESQSPARNHVPLRRSPQNASVGSDVPSTTVIKVLDENNTGGSCSCAASQSPIVKSSVPLSLPVLSEEGHRGSIHVDGKRIGPSVQKPPTVRDRALNTETTTVLDDNPKERDLKPSVKPSYVACSKFDLRTKVTDKGKRQENLSIDSCSNEEYPECAHVNDTDVISEEIYRPLPYNPNFVDSGTDPCLEPPPPVCESLHPLLSTEKQRLEFQAAAFPGGPVYPYSVQGPPRYEEVISQGVLSAEPPVHSALVRCVNAFGRYGELATQPGAFRSPTRINASRGGVVVVTDSAHRTVQAFNTVGECLALIRVNGDTANGCSCYDKNKLAVGTNCGVEVYNFNGTLKKTIPLGPVINTVTPPHGQGFIAVQPKALSIFRGPSETLVRTLRDRSKPGPVRQAVPFDSIADAAVNSQQDIVILDAGAASGLGMIFIVSDDGYLKSCIVPGREPCGVLRHPTAIAVDRAHNIVVSDSANRRVLLFAANGKFHRQIIGPGHGADLKTRPVGLDIGDDGRLFVVAKGDKFAEIRVFTYH